MVTSQMERWTAESCVEILFSACQQETTGSNVERWVLVGAMWDGAINNP